MMKYDAVIVAAGSGSRMGLGYNKVYYRPDQETVLEKTIHVFDGDDDCAHIIVVTDTEDYRKIIAIMEIVAKDIANGYVAIGGQTAVGRGIFEGRGEPEYSEDVDIKKCMNELYEAVTGGAV